MSNDERAKSHERNVALAERASAGDREAFDELMASHTGGVFAIAAAHLNRQQDVEDMVQEAFLRAWLLLPKLREPRAFTTWLMRLSRNLAQDWNRNSVRYVARLANYGIAQGDAKVPDPRLRMEDEDALNRVHETIQELPVELREVLMLHFVEDRTASEIARHLDVHPSTVRRQIDKGLGMVRRQLTSDETQAFRNAKSRAQACTAAIIAVAVLLPSASRAELAAGLAAPAGVAISGGGAGSIAAWFTRGKAIALVSSVLVIAAVFVVTQRDRSVGTPTPAVTVLPIDPMEQIVTSRLVPGQKVLLNYSTNPMGIQSLEVSLAESGLVQTIATMGDGTKAPFAIPNGVDFFMSYYTTQAGPLMMDAILVERTEGGANFTLETRTSAALGRIKDDKTIDAGSIRDLLRAEIAKADFYPTNPELRARTLALKELPLN